MIENLNASIILFSIAILLIKLYYNGDMSLNMSLEEEVTNIFSILWDLDDNRCNDGTHYKIDMQGQLKYGNHDVDAAEHHLFTWLDEEAIFKKPTYKAFYDLLDNYEVNIGNEEIVTKEEIAENWKFLEECLQSRVMKKAHQYLVKKNLAPADENEFKKKLNDMWFKLYRRSQGVQDSSGFEHVFVGEIKDDKVLGMHNWIQFVLQEKAGKVDYRGFFHRGKLSDASPRIINLKFTWGEDRIKPVGSTLVGTSPEFELAIYTVAFLLLQSRGVDSVDVSVAGYNVRLFCHPIARGKVGTCYFKKL